MFFKKKDERIGHILLTSEVIPLYSSTPAISNKTFNIVKQVCKDDKMFVIAERTGVCKYKDRTLYKKDRVLTQNEKPLVAKDTYFKEVICDEEFEKDGFKKKQIYEFKGLGFLGNIDADVIVRWVTDQFVIFESSNKTSISLYSYAELEALKRYNKIKLVDRQ